MLYGIRSGLKRTSEYVVMVAVLFWHKLPKIAMYVAAFYILFFVLGQLTTAYDKNIVSAEPATKFLKYTSFTVQNAREGEDVTFTVCREHKENYRVKGVKTVYVIPNSKKAESKKVFVYNKPISGVVDNGNCQSYFIRESEYHFKPGKYLITLNLDFRVKYDIIKHAFAKSSVFTVYPQPGRADIQTQLNNLNQQIRDLQQVISSLQQSGQVATPQAGAVIGLNPNQPSRGGQSATVSPSTNNSSVDKPAPATPTPTTKQECRVNVLFIHAVCREVASS